MSPKDGVLWPLRGLQMVSKVVPDESRDEGSNPLSSADSSEQMAEWSKATDCKSV